ncbi:hypothetical protein [Clostridium sp. LIBA-8841]|uniref:hypothetical protein n=1 Tax=Clostridium sp. LIBA-8841 TaxID=2987530 RepID=UPI002AC5F968|nr:hypothetical protein [Clostridium sp. LIBA-8841]MDZ5252296.1 hypothetical protein [Clostridium sp. LIBA-8841]
MDKLFTISGVDFLEKDFQDNINEFQDIIPIIQDFQDELKLEKIECIDKNDCCFKTKENYICELIGALTKDDEFYSLNELRSDYERFKDEMLYPFGIQVYKCTACNKWIINLLEE